MFKLKLSGPTTVNLMTYRLHNERVESLHRQSESKRAHRRLILSLVLRCNGSKGPIKACLGLLSHMLLVVQLFVYTDLQSCVLRLPEPLLKKRNNLSEMFSNRCSFTRTRLMLFLGDYS